VSETLSRILGPGFAATWVEETGSTNDDLKEAARSGAPPWTVLVASRQRQGRGREGRRWESPEGNLYLSVLLRPDAAWAGVLPLAAGVAVGEAAQELGVRPELKWPNDVMVSGRKIAGILVEGLSSGGSLEAAVVGVGMNLAACPESLEGAATSVRDEAGRTPDPLETAGRVLGRLRIWYDSLGRDGPRPVLEAFRARSVPWWGKGVEVFRRGERVAGTLRDLDPRGGLVLELEDGSRTTLLSGEARALRPLS
jgi:BirA family biotin operon repressor/biotin-[acetyl-CoA-carboxylase] ligase